MLADHEVLVKAREIQERAGLVKGLLFRQGARCMRGSIFEALTGDPGDWTADHHRIERIICEANNWEYGYEKIPEMNNADVTTQDDVLGWFDKAIEYTAPVPA